MTPQELNKELGNIDIYLLDQILKGRYGKEGKILDIGCGEGRNLVYFIRNGHDVYGIDQNSSAVSMLQYVARSLDPATDKARFVEADAEALPFPDAHFDALISSAVLHFAKDEKHFWQMLSEMHRVLRPGGSIFIRMTSDIGLEDKIQLVKKEKFALPDGSIRFLLTRSLLQKVLKEFQWQLLEPLKTVNVQDERCMSTLILEKKL